MCRLAVVVALVLLCSSAAPAALTERVSVSSTVEQGLSASSSPSMSADGRFVAFHSAAANLVAGDANDVIDVFVHDRQSGTTERVSVSTAGVEGNSRSWLAAISADGRYVAFQSYASNLVKNDTNNAWDIFLRDRESETTERVSLTSSGKQIAGNSSLPAISRDGRYVLFQSDASNVVPSDTNGEPDGFLRDREAASTECITVDAAGAPAGGNVTSISDDGRFVAFTSRAPGLVPEDTNAFYDVFVRDRVAGTNQIVSVDNDGQPLDEWCGGAPAVMSEDGRFIAFAAFALDLDSWTPLEPSQIYVRDLVAGTTEIVSVPIGAQHTDPTLGSYRPAISADGRFVAFHGNATNLVRGDTNLRSDIFVRDRAGGTTALVSRSSVGEQGNGNSTYPSISADGAYVAFESDSGNLVAWDTNGSYDVFLRDWQTRSTFADVPPHHWAWAQIETCCEADIVSGYDDGLYHPGWRVSRGQMAAYISRFAARRDANVPDPDPGGEPSFLDVPEQHWAYRYIEYAVAEKIAGGYGDGTYRPEDFVTRAQMAVFIARAMGWVDIADDMTTAPDLFEDVPAGYWAGAAIEACLQHGLIKECARNYYLPEAIVARDQMAHFIACLFDLPT